ncbi:formin-binding protein 1-like, partial [Clonorchis sinensis]
KLCEKYAVDSEKYFGTTSTFGSAINEFLRVTQLLVDTEGLVANSFELQGGNDVKQAIKSERHAMKRWKHDRDKLVSEMKCQTRIIDDEIKRYRDKYRDMVKANEEYARIEADISHSQNDVTKALTTAQTKTTEFDRARRDYQAALNQFNLYRHDHFNRTLPYWAHIGYQMTKDRYARLQSLFNALCERVRVMAERLNTVSSELQNISNTLDVEQDTELLVSHLRTGNPWPGDVAFVDLASAYPTPSPVPTDIETHREKASTMNIYATPHLPSNFYPSVSAADFAALKEAGLVKTKTDEPVYSGTSSLYSTVSAIITNGTARRPSVATSGVHSPPHTSGILRRLFSRRSHVYRRPQSLSIEFRTCVFPLGDTHLCYTDGNRTYSVYPVPKGFDLQLSLSPLTSHDLSRTHESTEFARRHQPLFESAKPWRRQKKRSLRRKSTTREQDFALASSLRTAQSTGNLAPSNHTGRPSSNEKSECLQLEVTEVLFNGYSDLACMHVISIGDQTLTTKLPSLCDGQPNAQHMSRICDLLDSSDFSDSSFESDEDSQMKVGPYAESRVLVGIKRDGVIEVDPDGSNSASCSKHLAPLAQPEASSYAYSVIGTNGLQYNGRGTVDTYDVGGPRPTAEVHESDITYSKPNPPPVSNRPKTLSNVCQSENRAELSSAKSLSPKSNRAPTRPPPISTTRISQSENETSSQKSDPTSGINGLNTHPTAAHMRTRRTVDSDTSPVHSTAGSPKQENAVVQSSPRIAVYDRRGENSPKDDSSKHYFPRKAQSRLSSSQDTAIVVGECTALYDFAADGFEPCYLAFSEGEKFYTLAPSVSEDTREWMRVIRFDNHEPGYVPTAFMQQQRYSQPVLLPTGNSSSREVKSSSCVPSPVHSVTTTSVHSRSSNSAVSSPTAFYKPPRNLRALGAIYSNRLAGSARGTDL